MNKLLSIALSCICSISVLHVNAQNPPPFSHFYANPFQFNPSFIANNGYAEANLFYKRTLLLFFKRLPVQVNQLLYQLSY